MPELVALELPAGEAFVDALRRVWDAGDAAFPLDPRLPPPAAADLLRAMAPGAVVGADGERRRLEAGRPIEPGDALVVATSGTTGEPKGVVLTHGAVAASAAATSARLAVDPVADRWLACLPLAHMGGLGVVTRALHSGTPLEVHERFEAGAVEEAARRGATLVSLVPTVLGRVDAGLFRVVLVGGAAPPTTRPANVTATYGLTETGGGVVYDGTPLEGVELRIGDGRLGAPGEVLVRAPMLLRGYRDGIDPRLPGGWLPTGDGGALDDTGRLSVTGRLAEVIVTGGEKVWPVDVEAVLLGHHEVADVQVVGRPDPEWGQVVVARVVPRDLRRPPSLQELRAHVQARAAPWSAPRRLELVDALARTPSGKLLRGPAGQRAEQSG
ncbi:MAG TPA: fatty acid--CoA ligase family protein [Acidimicrobiales bacterium]|nr:fatty acid--CoA ligase family protein [Acidimicrobiales bacterium]